MLAYPLARLSDLPRDPEIEPRGWSLHCGAPCGCRENLGEVRFDNAAARRWMIWLADDHYQPSATDVWKRRARVRRAKRQPWATGAGISPAPAIPDGTRQPIIVSDMRSWDAGRPQPVGHLIGPLGVGRTPVDVLIACRHEHVNRVTIDSIESEVRRLAETSFVL
jgi:hypothetical protein